MNTIREIQQINEQELARGIAGTPASWHAKYARSPWVYVGNLDHALTEGDVICVMSQFGEIEDIHLVREEDTGKSKGFGFCKYEDARSCVLAVDNFGGIHIRGRSLRVDHVENYRLPKHLAEKEEALEASAALSGGAGHAYEGKQLANEYSIDRGQDLFAPVDQQQQQNRQGENGNSDGESDDDGSGSDREAKREAKRNRKEERRRIRGKREELRKIKEQKRQQKEEKRRKKRSREIAEKGRFSDSDEKGGGDKHRTERKRRSRREDDSVVSKGDNSHNENDSHNEHKSRERKSIKKKERRHKKHKKH